jgi:tetratricopeptide (TPR) repeat protein
MWKIYSLIWLNYVSLFLAGICLLLLSVSFTKRQRSRFPILRKLDGKQIYLSIAVILFSGLGYGAYIYKEQVTLDLSFELSYGSDGSQAEKATSDGITIELRQSAAERIEEAKDYFNAGERAFLDKKYREAADSYQQSINITPTLSAYLNLALSLRYLSKYADAEPVLSHGLQLARRRGERKFEGQFLLILGAVLLSQDKHDQAEDTLKRSLEVLNESAIS